MTTIDIIGTLYTPIVTDADGEIVSGGEALAGWHANTIPEVPEWASCRVTPSAKRRVFAGMEAETCCYVFESEATFVAEATELNLIEVEHG